MPPAKKRHRSPAYPSLSLEDAVGKCGVIYKHEKRNRFDPDVALEHWGYEPGSANGMRAVAALKQYGLLAEMREDGDRHLELTELAFDILMPEEEGNSEYFEALTQAALSPTIFRDLWEMHRKSGLPSDRNLQRYLIKERSFNPSSVQRFIRVFRDTIAFAQLENEPQDEAEFPEESEETSEKPAAKEVLGGFHTDLFANIFPKTANIPTDKNRERPEMLELPLTLPSLKIAVFKLPAKMTELDFQTLQKTLDAWKGALVEPTGAPPVSSAGGDIDHEAS